MCNDNIYTDYISKKNNNDLMHGVDIIHDQLQLHCYVAPIMCKYNIYTKAHRF